MAIISHFWNKSLGDFGSIEINNVLVNPIKAIPTIPQNIWSSGYLVALEFGGVSGALFVVNGLIQDLRLLNIVTRVIDRRPLVWIGFDTDISSMKLNMDVSDRGLQSTPLQIDKNSHIKRLTISLNWIGKKPDVGKDALKLNGGTIDQMHWINTPPMYVSARVNKINRNRIYVKVSLPIKSRDLVAGVKIKLNGSEISIKQASYQFDKGVIIYKIATTLNFQDIVTWSYDEKVGSIQSLDGNYMRSVSAKRVENPDD